ncbi:MAG: integrase/recombinase XerC [Bacteroidetes bacterium]|nr:integrase/recombinase XerC [Bacteroidota bacterium]
MAALKDDFENYINECTYGKRLRPATIKASKEAYRQFARVVPEIETSEDVTPAVLTVFFQRLQTRERTVGRDTKVTGIKDVTIRAYAGRLKTFFKWLKDRKHISDNPFDTFKIPTPQFTDHRALTGDEIKRIMGCIVQHSGSTFIMRRDLAMIGILTFCGLRRTELISLEMRDVDIEAGFITVRSETSKSKRTRRLPINIFLRPYLKEYIEVRKQRKCKAIRFFVSQGKDRDLTLHGLKHWVERIVKKSGVRFHLHRLRHTFATNLGIQGVGAIKIQKLMGHSDLRMTQMYLRSIEAEELSEDMNKISFENLA